MHTGDHEAAATGLDAFLVHVQELVQPQQFNTWFRDVKVTDRADDGLRVLAPNSFVRDWISNYYGDILGQAARQAFGRDRDLVLGVDPDAPPAPRIEEPQTPGAAVTAVTGGGPARPARTSPELDSYSDTILHPDYRFDNFVVGASNQFANAAATAVAAAPGSSYNPLFLHGSVGLGKTHLLQAICHEILRREPGTSILYLSCESFINHFIHALETNDLNAFRRKYRNVDVFLVDDIQLLANKDRTQEEFFHTFNTIYNLGHQIVLSSDAPPKEIPTLQERLVSRFKMGLVVEMGAPDFETRVNILKTKSKLRGHDLPDEVAQHVAERVSTNIRELEGAVIRLIGYASLTDRPISLELAKEAMAGDTPTLTSATTIHDVVSVVTKYYQVRLSDLQSKRRTHSIAFPRQVCMYLARKTTGLSLGEIGGYFGGRDHTTVLYAEDKITKLVANDPHKRDVIQHLLNQIKER
ncbi:MAG: chromosomal replication initiator protein DnaA [Planctomycetota bacterium JB042]